MDFLCYLIEHSRHIVSAKAAPFLNMLFMTVSICIFKRQIQIHVSLNLRNRDIVVLKLLIDMLNKGYYNIINGINIY